MPSTREPPDQISWSPEGYTMGLMLSVRRAYLVALAVLVTVVVALHPYLGPSGLCGPGGCPPASEAHASASTDPSALARPVLAVAAAALALLAFRRPTSDPQPAEAYFSPDPHPPQPFPGR